MMRRSLPSILVALLLLAAVTPTPVAADTSCATGPGETLRDRLGFLEGREEAVRSQIEEAGRLLEAAQGRHDELWADAGTDPIDDEALLDEIDQLEARIDELKAQRFDLPLEIEACRRDLLDAVPPPATPHWERVAVHIGPRNTAISSPELVSPEEALGEPPFLEDARPTEVRYARCTATEERITAEWKNVDPRDQQVLSELQFAYTFQTPPRYFKPGDPGALLEIEATVTGEHVEGTAAPWTTGAYGGGLRSIDAPYDRKPPSLVLGIDQIPDAPAEAYLDFSISHGRQVGTYFLWAYVILAPHPIEACEVAWEYRYVE